MFPHVPGYEWTDKEKLNLIGSGIVGYRNLARMSDYRVLERLGKERSDEAATAYWLERNPDALPWLESKGWTIEDAIAEYEAWMDRRNAEVEWIQTHGDRRTGPMMAGADGKVELIRGPVTALDVLNGRAKFEDLPNSENRDGEGWPNQTTVAKKLGTNLTDIRRKIERGELKTNGKSGRDCRIEPASILEYCNREGATWNDS